MRIGILQAGLTPDELIDKHGSYANMFVRLLDQKNTKFDYSIYTVCENMFPESADACDAWLITGSEYGAYESHDWILALEQLVRDIVRAQLPLVGVCFGHQLIAQALGGRVEKSGKGWGLGLDSYQFTKSSPLEMNGQNQLNLQIFHQDQVLRLPPDATVYASSAFCDYAGFYIGDKLITIQAHPELPTSYNQDLLLMCQGNLVPEALSNRAIQVLDEKDVQADSEQFGQWMSAFFRQSVQDS